MPRMNGFGFLKEFDRLRADERYNSMVVMMFSSSENERDVKRALAHECVKGFLMKPITAQSLREHRHVLTGLQSA